MSVDLEHEPIHDLARRVIRLAEETQHAAQVLERRLDAMERRTVAAGRAERILSIALLPEGDHRGSLREYRVLL
ncbi:hypothetical protein ACIBO5_18555 [Nonomuraea angiospora]|uniref:hypothetical protein n=1 Tax=Nonomuraea angiospora TaxID=46172 RepID=UPI0029A82AFC|nr:hypothetical protein [Nonomuraea angiospora]MDX3099780.1 hypothetical protein [Nonomuraea angiospora]